MRELDVVVLKRDISEHGLRAGDIGTIVHGYADGKAYAVEFVTAEGNTVAVLTLESADVRPMADREILHARELTASEAGS